MTLVRSSRLQWLPAPKTRPTGQVATRVGGGAYRGSGTENFVAHLPGRRSDRWGPTILWCHAAFGSALETQTPVGVKLVERFTAMGMPVLCADLGGPLTWANDDAQLAANQALAYGGSAFGTRTDRVAFVGTSMGGALMANVAARNMTRVAFMYGLVPVLNIQDVVDNPNNAGGLRQTVFDAYGGTEGAWLAAAPTHDPVQDFIARPLAALGPRLRIDADVSDTIIRDTGYEAFMAKCPDADFRWFPGNHATPNHDPVDVGEWAGQMARVYGG